MNSPPVSVGSLRGTPSRIRPEYARLNRVVRRSELAHAAAARRSLRDQIARLELELAATLARTYPRVTAAGRSPTAARACSASRARAHPRRARRARQRRRAGASSARAQAQARARLQAMRADPPRFKGAVDHQRRARPARLHDLRGPPSGRACSAPGGASRSPPAARDAGTTSSKRRRRPKTTAPQVPPRPPRARVAERPRSARRRPGTRSRWSSSAVLRRDRLHRRRPLRARRRHGRTLLALGFALGALGGLDTAVREHFAGYRSHTLVLAAFPAVAVAVLGALAGAPLFARRRR